MAETGRPCVRDVESLIDDSFPFSWAEDWDRNGLLAGDPAEPVTNVFVSLDPTLGALERAQAAGANVLVTHHPLYLDPPQRIVAGAHVADVLLRAAHHGIALINAHTNLDRAPEGADALPLAVGLTPVSPLETGRMRVAVVTVYTPEDSAELLVERMTSAGAGGVGRYSGCAFVSSGQGTFIPGPGSAPAVGHVGERAHAREQRIEMVCDPDSVASVVGAARSAHPYEEPVILVSEKEIERGAARLGRLSEAPGSPTLSGFAADVAARLGCTPTVWGDARRTVRLVATNCGSGGALLQDALRAGASVFLTGEVRYHIALEAIQSGMAVIEAGHDVTEWPLVEVLVRALRLHAGLADRVVADKPVALWWTP